MLNALIWVLTFVIVDSESCALNPDGTMKDAEDIVWYNDPNDAQPIPSNGDSSSGGTVGMLMSYAFFLIY